MPGRARGCGETRTSKQAGRWSDPAADDRDRAAAVRCGAVLLLRAQRLWLGSEHTGLPSRPRCTPKWSQTPTETSCTPFLRSITNPPHIARGTPGSAHPGSARSTHTRRWFRAAAAATRLENHLSTPETLIFFLPASPAGYRLEKSARASPATAETPGVRWGDGALAATGLSRASRQR